MLFVIVKFDLHLSESDKIDDILPYLFSKKRFRDRHKWNRNDNMWL